METIWTQKRGGYGKELQDLTALEDECLIAFQEAVDRNRVAKQEIVEKLLMIAANIPVNK